MAATDLIYYDGGCGLCHRTVLFALRHDPDGSRFRYAPLGGQTFQAAFPAERRTGLPDSIVVTTGDGRVLVRSDAALHIGVRLGGGWGAVAGIVGLLPRWLLDWGYDRIAVARKRLFAAPKESCPMVPAELRGRFQA